MSKTLIRAVIPTYIVQFPFNTIIIMSCLTQHGIILMLCYDKNTIPLHMQGASIKRLIKN